jgi:LPS-assembly protein
MGRGERGGVKLNKGPSMTLGGRIGMLTRPALLAGVAAAALIGAAAHGQSVPIVLTPPPAKPSAPPDDGLSGSGFYLEADQLISDDAHHRVTARGGVEARYNGRVLRAAEVVYDQQSGVVTARGNVAIINADGSAQFAQAITLDKDLSEGVALGFSTRLSGDVKIAAASAVRQSDQVTELNRAIYTPCPVCAEDNGRPPTWSIRARKVVQDHKRQIVYFQDAVIQVMGVGIVYLPAFWTADPQAPRKSGFLEPVMSASGKRGFSFQEPYYQVISRSQDLIISPQLNSKVNPFLNVDWRRRFYSGVVDLRAGYTYERDFDSGGNHFGPLTSRSYVLGSGVFNVGRYWQWGFTAERASDPLIFDKYDIGRVFEDRGLYAADDRRLISQLYAVRQDATSYLSVAAISVQGLRSTDVNRTFPTIAPLIEGRWEAPIAILGGRLRIDGSAVVLDSNQSPDDPLLPGINSRRATLQGDWLRTFTFANGFRLQPFAQARGDIYNLTDLPAPFASTATVSRGLGTIGANLSYPLIKQAGDVTWLLEPLAQIAISPNTRLDPRIPDEDSAIWEFDETNLFDVNKSPGFDLYEGGQRVNVGGRGTVILADGRSGSLLIGRSFRAADDPAIPERTGLQTALSDYIIGAEATPLRGVSLFSRWRLDSTSLGTNRLEAGASFAISRITGYVSYLQEAQAPTLFPVTQAAGSQPNPCAVVSVACTAKVKSLDFRGEIYATRHWGITVYGIRDIDGGEWRKRDVGIVYRDDCIRVELLYRRDETFNGTLGPSSAVVLRLNLATLGNSGYSR